MEIYYEKSKEKQVLKLSQKEWIAIGNKAGWLKNAQHETESYMKWDNSTGKPIMPENWPKNYPKDAHVQIKYHVDYAIYVLKSRSKQ